MRELAIMKDSIEYRDRSDTETFEIIESDGADGMETLVSGDGRNASTSSAKHVGKIRVDNHAGFGMGLGCTFSSLFSGLTESPLHAVKKCSPIWLLGSLYLKEDVHTASWKKKRLSKKGKKVADPFRSDFYSRLWFTYRRNFPKLGSRFTSDCGWGCMLRTGQMMLAHALVVCHLGREWRWNPQNKIAELDDIHRGIIAAFGDLEHCPLSLHKLVEYGGQLGKSPGDWFGPSSIAFSLRNAVDQSRNTCEILSNIRIYVSSDTTIVSSEVEGLFEMSKSAATCVVVLVPVRLGVEKLNPMYVPCLQQLLAMHCTLGIIGGRPKHSLYFNGWQDEYLIYLDPHRCQQMVDVCSSGFPLDSFHCNIPRRLPFRRLDPSMCFGFFFQSLHEFHEFKDIVPKIVTPGETCNFSMFSLSEAPIAVPTSFLESISDSQNSDPSLANYELL